MPGSDADRGVARPHGLLHGGRPDRRTELQEEIEKAERILLGQALVDPVMISAAALGAGLPKKLDSGTAR
ncbi:MAG: hypothetical protein U1E17_07965 [Geminicoccaceae bacterium]